MKNTKWYLLSIGAAAALSIGSVACDDAATSCESDDDCDTESGEACDIAEGVCQIACESDADCDSEAGEVCCAEGDIAACSAECGGGTGGSGGGGTGGSGGGGTCPDGEGLDANGECRPVCADQADCYALEAYCAADGLCYGVDLFSCARADLAPAMEASGPLLSSPQQLDLDGGTANCTKEPAACTNNGNVCGWAVYFFDPDGDFPGTKAALYGKTKFIQENGTGIAAYNVDAPNAASATANLYGCYDEGNTSPEGAFQIEDNAGNNSNAVCVAGSAP